MAGSNGVIRKTALSKAEIAYRERLLQAISVTLDRMKACTDENSFGSWDEKLFEQSFETLESVQMVMQQDKQQFDVDLTKTLYSEFPLRSREEYERLFGQKGLRDGFFNQERIAMLSHFLERSLPNVRAAFHEKQVVLPPALEILHEEWDKLNAKSVERRETIFDDLSGDDGHENKSRKKLDLPRVDDSVVPGHEWVLPLFGCELSPKRL